MLKRFLASVAAVIMLAGSAAGFPMDMNKYCRENFGFSSTATALSKYDAASWRCRTGDGLTGISLLQLCRQQYGSDYAYALGDPRDASSWSCVRKQSGDVKPSATKGFWKRLFARTPQANDAMSNQFIGTLTDDFFVRYQIVDDYYDAAVSGADPIDKRPGFMDMLRRVASNGAKTIIVESPDRFARDLIVQLTGHDILKAHGIALVPTTAPDFFYRRYADRRPCPSGARCYRAIRKGVHCGQAGRCKEAQARSHRPVRGPQTAV